jgi:hypothetical protein
LLKLLLASIKSNKKENKTMIKKLQMLILVCVFSTITFGGDYPNGRTCQPTPTTPCPTSVGQAQELPVLSIKEQLVLLIKTIRLF